MSVPPTELLHIVTHALGFYGKPRGRLNRRWSYRNCFCAPIADPDSLATMQRLVDTGWMVAGRTINEGRDRYYHVTDDGARAAGVFNRFRLEDRLKLASKESGR